MSKSNYMEEQIAFALKQAKLGTPVSEVCRKIANYQLIDNYV
ncbi:MAG: hypothetical protein ABFD11_11725 [Christensenella sp.]